MIRPRPSLPARKVILAILTAAALLAGLAYLLTARAVFAGAPGSPTRQGPDGAAIYEQRCAACHGIDGDGQGPGAEQLLAPPRDFTRDEYKIKSTEGNEFPSREDLMAVISEGMPGTSMPAWASVMSEAEIGAVADYVQSVGRFFPQEGYGETPVEIPRRVNPSAESIARGRELFEGEIECAKCHGLQGRGDGPSAFELEDNSGNPIFPADLTQPWTFRGGASPEDIYLRMRTGLTGSPMPSFASSLSPEDTWDLVNYILSLSDGATGEPSVLLVGRRLDGAVPTTPDDPRWAELTPGYYPLAGQIMRTPRYFQPSINAVWVRSFYSESEISFLVEWNDRTETTDAGAPDAVALQFPVELEEGAERPYFVFGDSERAVYQMAWSADRTAAVERNANGLGALSEQDSSDATANARFSNGRWQVVFTRPLGAGAGDDLSFVTDVYIPISFMAWDGAAGETGAALGLTTWSLLFLEAPASPTRFVWIPIVVAAVVVLELLVVWLVRRSAKSAPA